MEIRLEKTQSLVKEYMETSQISEDDGLQKENQKLIQTLNDTSKFHSEELKLFKRTKEDLFNKIRELEKENNRMKEEIMSFYKIKDEIKKRDKELERSR